MCQVAFVAGIADANGYGWAIARQLCNAGASVVAGTWPPALKIFKRGLERGFGDKQLLADGSAMKFQGIYALDGQLLVGVDFD